MILCAFFLFFTLKSCKYSFAAVGEPPSDTTRERSERGARQASAASAAAERRPKGGAVLHIRRA